MKLLVILLLIAIILMIAEFLVLPGLGVCAVASICCFALSVVLTFTHFNTVAGVIVLALSLIICTVCVYFLLRPKTWKKAALSSSIDSKAIATPQDKGIEVGMKGKSIGRLSPSGNAIINGQSVEVHSQKGVIAPDTDIEVTGIDGMQVFVKEA